MTAPKPGRRRRAATLVETTLVMAPLLMFLFGIFEYGRLLMDWNLLNNAVREGCRYATVNNTSATISTDVQTVVTNFLAGEKANFSSFTVTVSGTSGGVATAVNNLGAGDLVTVKVTATYKFLNIIPYVSSPSLTISDSVVMVCEGVT